MKRDTSSLYSNFTQNTAYQILSESSKFRKDMTKAVGAVRSSQLYRNGKLSCTKNERENLVESLVTEPQIVRFC